MTQVATPETLRANFDDVRVDEVIGSPVRLQLRDRKLWAEFDAPGVPGPGAAPRMSREIVMTTGSHHQEVYWYRPDAGRLVEQLPVTYLIRERRWVPRRMVFLHASLDGSGPAPRWSAVCINCHATHGKARTTDGETTVGEFGIACEACHGPSVDHIRANRSPARRYQSHFTAQPDATIVQPERLDPTRSSQVCGQCHGVWFFDDPSEQKRVDAFGFPYRPGQDLLASRFLIQPAIDKDSPTMRRVRTELASDVKGTFWPDGMIRVSGREYNGLVDSPCYLNAKDATRTMTCSSCHTMHKTVDDPRSIDDWAVSQVSLGKDTNEACLQCHPKFRANLAAHTKHQPASSGSSCYNCHMPYTTYGLMKALRSHQISSPSVAVSQQTGRPNACNLCHLDKSMAWASENLARSYGTPQPALSDEERTVAASLLWLLRGDAGQRALVAWAMGWQPAQQTSGTDWLGAYLSGVLTDDYGALRFIGYRSLRTLGPAFAEMPFRFVTTPQQRLESMSAAVAIWRRTTRHARSDSALLLNADGSFKLDQLNRLVQQRDNRPVNLYE